MSLKDLANSIKRKEVLIPALKKFLLKERALVEAGKKSRSEMVIHDADMTIKAFQERKEEYNHDTPITGQYFHPSRLGTCLRLMVFGAKEAPVNSDKLGDALLREAMIFEMGTYLGTLIQNLCERAGLLVRREVPIMSAKHKTLGHADGDLLIDGEEYILEIKTINTRGFNMLTEPKREHVQQVHAYMRPLKRKKAIILYFDKDRNTMKEYVVLFDAEFYKKHVKRRIRRFFKSLDKNLLPPREGTDPNRFPCMFCEFSRLCYDSMALKTWMKKHKMRHFKIKKTSGLYED